VLVPSTSPPSSPFKPPTGPAPSAPADDPALITRDFAHEYESEIESLTRGQMLVWLTLWLGLWTLWLTIHAAAVAFRDGDPLTQWLRSAEDPTGMRGGFAGAVQVLIQSMQWGVPEVLHATFCIALLSAARFLIDGNSWARRRLMRTAFWVLLAHAAATVALARLHNSSQTGTGDAFRIASTFWIPALILPWSVAEAATVALGLIIVWEVGRLWLASDSLGWVTLFQAQGLVLLMTPGVLIAWFRQSRLMRNFESRMLRRSHEWFSRELFDAERIHDAMFPAPQSAGPVHFAFADRTAEGIGGALLHAHPHADGDWSLILLQAGGHGIAAAMTVNRLHGELERLFAQRPDAAPVDVLDAVGHYASLMLTPYNITAYAAAFRLGPDGQLAWAIRGHPGAAIRNARGEVLFLNPDHDSPVALLESRHQGSRTLVPDETLIAWTCEELDPRTQLLSAPAETLMNRIRAAIASPAESRLDLLPAAIVSRINDTETPPSRPRDVLILAAALASSDTDSQPLV